MVQVFRKSGSTWFVRGSYVVRRWFDGGSTWFERLVRTWSDAVSRGAKGSKGSKCSKPEVVREWYYRTAVRVQDQILEITARIIRTIMVVLLSCILKLIGKRGFPNIDDAVAIIIWCLFCLLRGTHRVTQIPTNRVLYIPNINFQYKSHVFQVGLPAWHINAASIIKSP